MRVVLGRSVIFVRSLRNFAQEFSFGPMKAADSVNIPGTFFNCFAVLQNDDILCPTDGHGLCQYFRCVFIRPVKLPHPAEVSGGETRGVEVSVGKIFGGGGSGAFLCPGVDELANLAIQFHLRRIRRH